MPEVLEVPEAQIFFALLILLSLLALLCHVVILSFLRFIRSGIRRYLANIFFHYLSAIFAVISL